MEKRVCAHCGAQFEARELSNQKYCSIQCQRKACRKLQGEADETKAIEYMSKHPEWEYIGGYTGSEGTMIIRHICGYTTKKSSETVRHGRKLKCMICDVRDQKERKERAEKKKQQDRETKRLYQPVKKVKQEEMKACAVCGAFFVGNKKQKYCGDGCRKKVQNRYFTDKRDKRRRLARTEQSNEITVLSLYRRDNGVCWICGGLCDINADGNDNNYPSIDHIIPVSMGGKDRWDNVKLAHRICNSIRQNKTIDYIPRLAILT